MTMLPRCSRSLPPSLCCAHRDSRATGHLRVLLSGLQAQQERSWRRGQSPEPVGVQAPQGEESPAPPTDRPQAARPPVPTTSPWNSPYPRRRRRLQLSFVSSLPSTSFPILPASLRACPETHLPEQSHTQRLSPSGRCQPRTDCLPADV